MQAVSDGKYSSLSRPSGTGVHGGPCNGHGDAHGCYGGAHGPDHDNTSDGVPCECPGAVAVAAQAVCVPSVHEAREDAAEAVDAVAAQIR